MKDIVTQTKMHAPRTISIHVANSKCTLNSINVNLLCYLFTLVSINDKVSKTKNNHIGSKTESDDIMEVNNEFQHYKKKNFKLHFNHFMIYLQRIKNAHQADSGSLSPYGFEPCSHDMIS